MHLCSDSNLTSFQRTHSAAPFSIHWIYCFSLLNFRFKEFSLQWSIFFIHFAALASSRQSKLNLSQFLLLACFPTCQRNHDLPNHACFKITDRMFNQGNEEALWAFKLSPNLCRSLSRPFPPISHPVRCRTAYLRLNLVIASSLHYGWDPPYVHPYMWHASVRLCPGRNWKDPGISDFSGWNLII